MNDGEDNILTEAHRYSRQAEEAVKKGHWQQAIDKHSRAAQNFQACIGLTTHPAGDKVLQQLAEFHLESADRVRARLQPQPIRPHFAPQPPLLIHVPITTSIEFAGSQGEEELAESVVQDSVELSKLESGFESSVRLSPHHAAENKSSSLVEVIHYSPTIINIQIQTTNPIMTAKTQAHIQQLDSLLSQLSLACQSESTQRIPTDIVHSFVNEMRGQVNGLRDSFSNVPPTLPQITTATTAPPPSTLSASNRLEEQVAALERQLASETLLRRQQQKKLENAEIVIEKHKKRWKLLKEAAKKKDGDFKDSQAT